MGGEEEGPSGANVWKCEVGEGASECAGGAWGGLRSEGCDLREGGSEKKPNLEGIKNGRFRFKT